MGIRTDVRYENGNLKVADSHSGTDTRYELPEVDRSDLLLSGAYGESWKQEAGVSDSAIDSLAATQSGIAKSFNTLMEIRGKQSPHNTQAQHLDNLNKDYDQAISRFGTQMDRATDHANSRLKEIDQQFRQHVGWDEKDAQELRAVVRGMDSSERSEFISDAVANGDGQALAAILGSHPSLVGLTKEQQQNYRQRAIRTNAPRLANLESTVSKARDTTRKAFIDFIERKESVTAKSVREKYQQQAEEHAAARKRATGDNSADRWNLFG